MEIITNSEKETFEFAKSFAKDLKGGEIFALEGDLGAGKTVFAKGLASGLGVRDNVSSPTFVVMKVYKIKMQNAKCKNLVHIDAYRLNSAKDLEGIGAEEYFERDDAVVLIEWPEKIKKILPKKAVIIKIKHLEEGKRLIKI